MDVSSDWRIAGRRSLSPDEVSQASELVDRCNRIEVLELPLDVSDESAAGSDDLGFVLASDGDALVGILQLQWFREVEVCLAVDPAFRRQGIGRALVAFARDAVKRRGKSRWLLVTDEASPAGRAFIQAIGAAYHSSEYRLLLDPALVSPRLDVATPVILRRGTADDVELIGHLTAVSIGDADEDTSARVARAMSQENHRYFVASVDGEPIGTIRTNYYGSTIYITAFSVLPRYRGRGFGRQILLQIVELLVGERWTRVYIEVDTDNRNALGLYQSCGFREVAAYSFFEQEI